jgi:2,3-bisphosphoglycerate-independent phosphoglycerate mutase
MGNSEVGHMNIGAGRVVYQELARINKELREGLFASQPKVKAMVDYCRQNTKPLHILVLASNGGVHSHIDHLEYATHILSEMGIEEGYIHAFTDGRDTGPNTGKGFIEDIIQFTADTHFKLASMIGRYYAMDRDKRWERVFKAYNLLVNGVGNTRRRCHYIHLPTVINKASRMSFLNRGCLLIFDMDNLPTIQAGDAVLFLNFRTDRPRQLTEVLTQHDHLDFNMHTIPLHYTTMTRYDETFHNIHVIYEKDNLNQTLGEVISNQGLIQLRVAETEKYPHVTFFFSGGREEPFEGENRSMVASPKVATYDLMPEMSALGVCEAVLNSMDDIHPRFYLCQLRQYRYGRAYRSL